MAEVGIIIVLFIVLVATITIPIVLSSIHNKTRENNFVFNKQNSDELVVLHRKKENEAVLLAKQGDVKYSQYHPGSATFTAATVGGVTTGGWDIKEEHYSIETAAAASNKYVLMYKLKDEYFSAEKDRKERFPIRKIILSPEDANAALKNPIVSKFRRGNCLILENRGDEKLGKAAANLSSSNYYLAADMMYAYDASKNLSYKEVNEIIHFLCGET